MARRSDTWYASCVHLTKWRFWRGFTLFCDDLLQYLPVQRQIGYDPFELAVLFSKLSQFPEFLHSEPGVLLLPAIKSCLTDPKLAAQLPGLGAGLRLLQRGYKRRFDCSPTCGRRGRVGQAARLRAVTRSS